MSDESVSTWRALALLVRPDAGRYAFLAVVIGLTAGLPLVGPLIVRAIIDGAESGDATSGDLVTLAIAYLVVAAVSQVVGVLAAWAATSNAWHTANGLRLGLTRHVLDLDHEFHRRHTPGELIQRIDGDVTAVSDFLGRVILKVGGAFLLMAGMILVLLALDWRLGLLAAVYLAVSVRLLTKRANTAISDASDELGVYARLYGGIEERLTASEDLRALGARPHAMWGFISDSRAALRSTLRTERSFLLLWWGIQGSIALGVAIAISGSAALLARDAITIGTAFLLFQYTMLLRQPMEDVIDEIEVIQQANGAMARVADLLAVRPAVVDRGTVSPPPGSVAVDLDDVSFHYDDGEPVLSHVDLHLAAGRSIGVVGRTGGGKTTLSRLVLRLIEPTAGTVRVGGVPIQDVPLEELRRRVAMIPQEVQLIRGTIRDNVTLFDHRIGDSAVEQALREVGLDDLVAEGIDAPLGAGGIGLSAGQSQLLALARVWLREPDLVVLDEATSRVDPDTEQKLEAAIGRLLTGRTAIVVAHRLSTLRRVDEIAVVDDGRIVERGERRELEAAGESAYRRLLELAREAPSGGADEQAVGGESSP